MNEKFLTREELYDRVWQKAAVHVAGELGISDVALGKICRKMDVPKPPRGYWAMIEAGQKIRRAPLPKALANTVVQLDTSTFPTVCVPAEGGDYPRSVFPEPEPIQVRADLKNAPAIVAMVGRFVSGKEYTPGEKVDLPSGSGFPAVSVSIDQLDRSLRILSALVIFLESKGYMTDVSAHRHGEETRVSKDGEDISLALSEQFRKVTRELSPEEKKKPPYLLRDLEQFLPSGKLRIKISTSYGFYEMWQDRKDDPLEGRLIETIAGIITAIGAKIARRREREEEQRSRELAARKREEETRRRNDLDRDAAAWKKSEEIRTFLHAYQSRLVKASNELDPEGEKARWLQWALDYAEQIDPLNKIFVAD